MDVKLIIAGSRGLSPGIHFINDLVTKSINEVPTEIVSGMAKGVDLSGEAYGHFMGTPIKRFPADWSQYGRSAGMVRNGQMADYGDYLLAIWDGISKGTKNMIKEMDARGKPVLVCIIRTWGKQ